MRLANRTIIISLIFSLVIACSGTENKRSYDEDTALLEAEQAAVEQVKLLEQEAAEKERLARIAADKEAAEKSRLKKIAAEKESAEQARQAKIIAEKETAQKAEQSRMAQLTAMKEAEEKAKKSKQVQAAVEKEAAQQAKQEEMEAIRIAEEQANLAKIKQQEEMAAQAAAEAENQQADEARRAAAMKAQEDAFVKNSANVNADDKTPVGAQRSGNKEGTIPAWTGGITKPPAGYKPGDHHQDPFLNDEILFTIDASNYQQYADKLSVGQKAMFEKYPDTYKMSVYKTRRSASFPERIYQKTIENGKTGRLTGGGEGVENVAEGFPFPNATNAYELILNHKLKYKGSGGVRYNNQVAPTANGRYTVVKLKEELLGKYYVEGNTVADIDNILLYFYQVVESPARLAGRILLVHETMNQQEQPRQAWIYNPGQRRVRRAPNVAYDNPGTASDGLRTNDMTDMFNGAMDRFDWKVTGKKEMYVPYNSYKVHSADLDYTDIVRPGHLNQDLMRYELHRMFVVEATLKEGVRHINSRRTFYLDEDSYQIMLTDHYDRRGEIWRFSEAHCINYYDVPTFWSTVEVHHDLRSGRYVALGLDNKDPVNTFNVPLSEVNYTPQALRKRGRR